MKTNMLKNLFLIALLMGMFACGQSTDVVESGTYQGTIDKVNADESEIYVNTQDDKRLELYFTEQTTLTQGGQTATFDALQEGQQVEVTVERKGNRLDPIAVNIIQ